MILCSPDKEKDKGVNMKITVCAFVFMCSHVYEYSVYVTVYILISLTCVFVHMYIDMHVYSHTFISP